MCAQIVAGVAGNPLALVELAGELTPAELSGAAPLGWPLRFGGRLEELYLARVRALPGDTRTVLLLAAADPTGDPALVAEAAGQLGIDAEAGEAAGTRRLVSWQPRVRFRHPLIRSAAYYAAPAGARRAAHAALAQVTDPGADPDRRAWHRAQAAPEPDEEVAAGLERSAGRAQARGGLGTAAAFLKQAAALTPDPARRADRALAAAQASVRAGAFDQARDLLAAAEAGPLGEFEHARADLVRAWLAFATGRGSDAPQLMLTAARRLEPIDADLARMTYLDALGIAIWAGRLASPGGDVLTVARAAGAAPSPRTPSAIDILLDGLAGNVNQGYAAGLPILRKALSAFASGMRAEQELRWLSLAFAAALDMWDDGRWDLLTGKYVRLARDLGALSELPSALGARAFMLLFTGELTAAAALTEEARAATEATGSRLTPHSAVAVAALHGNEAEASALIEATLQDVSLRGEGIGITIVEWANAVLSNGLGRYNNALVAAQRAAENPWELAFLNWALVELVEAAARSGASETAVSAYRRLAERTAASGTDWALGIEVRCRALLSDGEAAESCTARPSTGSAGPGSAWNWPAPTWYTGSGCAASAAAARPVTSSAPRSRCSRRWAWRHSRNGPDANCRPPASGPGRAAPRRRRCSHRRRRRSPGWPPGT